MPEPHVWHALDREGGFHGAAVLVSAKLADDSTPDTLAVTLKPPRVALAVAVTLAIPNEFVVADGADSVADAPEPGAEKFTVIPLKGLPDISVTLACNAVAYAEPMVVDCGVPAKATRSGLRRLIARP